MLVQEHLVVCGVHVFIHCNGNVNDVVGTLGLLIVRNVYANGGINGWIGKKRKRVWRFCCSLAICVAELRDSAKSVLLPINPVLMENF